MQPSCFALDCECHHQYRPNGLDWWLNDIELLVIPLCPFLYLSPFSFFAKFSHYRLSKSFCTLFFPSWPKILSHWSYLLVLVIVLVRVALFLIPVSSLEWKARPLGLLTENVPRKTPKNSPDLILSHKIVFSISISGSPVYVLVSVFFCYDLTLPLLHSPGAVYLFSKWPKTWPESSHFSKSRHHFNTVCCCE